jgi:hypothetical protein
MAGRVDDVRMRLRKVLAESVVHHDRLLGLVDDESTSPARLVDEVTVLESLDDERDELIERLKEESRRAATDDARGQPVRALVLDALREMKVPENAAFMQEFIWGRFRVDLETRGFGSLRRDERRSWERNPEKRSAYVTPAISETGEARADYMTRSDWPLARRIIVSKTTERILDLRKILILLDARDDEQFEVRGGFDAPLERYASELLGIEPPRPSRRVEVGRDTEPARNFTWEGMDLWRKRGLWRAELRKVVDEELARLEPDDEAARVRAAALLAELPMESKLWGFGETSAALPR